MSVQLRKTAKDDEDETYDGEVKSQAVVKYSNVQAPANFSQLQCNTDLNMPPSNWLRNSINFYGMQQAAIHRSGFSSFRMAHRFPDCVGGVDVVCDAEIIKRLLMLPYARNTSISMMVHRIGNTLLIDEFDIYKHLLQQSPVQWDWLKRFIYDKIINGLTDEERMFLVANRSRNVLQERRLISKFLYHSLPREPQESVQPKEKPSLQMLPGPRLPEPEVEHSVPDPSFSHTFNRSIVWTFEDIRMLIGTDMPIFGGGTRPCISLRLRDMSKPINVLTGIDYWLDNLMCNVPEVVMCYHLDGIVQKYELVKTEDLPFLENSQFSPKIIRNVAQNILAFLKANATKAGHTYWLFKRPKDDVVKLYDLTTLCTEGECEAKPEKSDAERSAKDENIGTGVSNPFTIPVAMLLYSVARNMKSSVEKMTNKQAGAIKMLLDNCIKLLPKEKYPQIVVSSHYMLSDLNVPSGAEPSSVSFPNGSDDSEFDDESLFDEDESDGEDFLSQRSDLVDQGESIAVKNIQETMAAHDFKKKNWKNNSRPPALSADVEKRCLEALENIVAGLKCLKYFNDEAAKTSEEQKKQKIRKEAENLNMAKPYQPIPLPYETLTPQPKFVNPDDVIPLGWKALDSREIMSQPASRKKAGKKLSVKAQEELLVAEKAKDVKCWSLHLRLLLLEKACLTYSILGEHAFAAGDFSSAFRFTNLAFRCQNSVSQHWPSVSRSLNVLLARAGDCYLQFVKRFSDLEVFVKGIVNTSGSDKIILEFIESEEEEESRIELPIPTGSVENLMMFSLLSYEKALKADLGNLKHHLTRRIGNVVNELGSFYMQEALMIFNGMKQGVLKNEETPDDCQQSYLQLMAKAHTYLTKSVSKFEEVDDHVNLALIHCNMGRYNRQMADMLSLPLQSEAKKCEAIYQMYYSEAFASYNRALGMLEVRKNSPQIWDILFWELSTSTFILAQKMQDLWDVKCARYQEIMELLQRSLKLCQTHSDPERSDSYLYRTGQINTRLGMVCGNVVRYQSAELDDKKRKNMLQLCRFYYDKAVTIFRDSSHLSEAVEVLTDLLEFTNSQIDYPGRVKALQHAMNVMKNAREILRAYEGPEEIVRALESQYQSVFKNLVRVTVTAPSRGGKEKEANAEFLNAMKKMYSVSLGRGKVLDNISALFDIYSTLNLSSKNS
ncbi:erythroid differentiation-related factor 1 [Phlebotomus argentipes]|uniref:erythroid differentiation-related factor 1 n=1 Tax=Phlebotomus argentipes TaxID=94469 RepID=UPI002892E239|nr:erythroid differentiation-related factor 1 [Phlebotomus argentipes]